MITTRVPMTVEGAQALKEELKRLKEVDRPNISKAIGEARELGDLKENAEYHAAKEQQGLIEAKIKYLQSRLNQAQVIDITMIPNQGRVIFGATVTLINCDTDKSLTVRLVGEEEADIKSGKMSITAPIARACVGKSIGDFVEVDLPEGGSEYEITAIEHIG
ncbi:MAG: transcription elongation factor GreA [Pseudomonadota bacterium]|nr:transcription elongation factor GreA [Pseudomonadota bacterium]